MVDLPSKTDDKVWIYAVNPNQKPELDLDQLEEYINSDMVYTRDIYEDSAKRLTSPVEKKMKMLDIDAIQKGSLVGKWLIFEDRRYIDEVWSRIATAVEQGRLGIAAKVSTLKQGKQEHVICVYTYNFLDRDDVRRIRNIIRELGIIQRIYYKPDHYTRAGIYFGTTEMPASRYFG